MTLSYLLSFVIPNSIATFMNWTWYCLYNVAPVMPIITPACIITPVNDITFDNTCIWTRITTPLCNKISWFKLRVLWSFAFRPKSICPAVVSLYFVTMCFYVVGLYAPRTTPTCRARPPYLHPPQTEWFTHTAQTMSTRLVTLYCPYEFRLGYSYSRPAYGKK